MIRRSGHMPNETHLSSYPSPNLSLVRPTSTLLVSLKPLLSQNLLSLVRHMAGAAFGTGLRNIAILRKNKRVNQVTNIIFLTTMNHFFTIEAFQV